MISKKAISWVLILSMTLLSFTHIGVTFASEETNNFTEEFLNATDDTIVCYMEGIPITKKQIDENGFIDKETMDHIEQMVNSDIVLYATSNYVTIPSGYNQAVVRTSLTAPRYSQTNTKYYLTHLDGAKFASGIEQKNWVTITGIFAGFIPNIGPTVTILFSANAFYKSSVAGKIRSYTNSGKKVHVTEAKSKYGTFYGVFGWTNRIIETHKTYSNGTVERVTNLQYKR